MTDRIQEDRQRVEEARRRIGENIFIWRDSSWLLSRLSLALTCIEKAKALNKAYDELEIMAEFSQVKACDDASVELEESLTAYEQREEGA